MSEQGMHLYGGHLRIKEAVRQLQSQITSAANRAGRDPKSIKLIAVSKTKPPQSVYEACGEGILAFGENYAHELLEKKESELLADIPGIEWHMIGHIQTNKVKALIGKTALVHSLDSIRLASSIQRHSEKASLVTDALIEVNIAREESKHGFLPEEVHMAVEQISIFRNIRILGLMCCAPFTKNPEDNRVYFDKLREIYIDIGRKELDNVRMHFLSMGMSGDFEVAVEEGSTMLRIGTRLFGGR